MKASRVHGLRYALAVAIMGAALAGCSVISAIPSATFTQSVTVKDPDLSAVANNTYSGQYTIVTPPGVYAMNRTIKVSVTVNNHLYSTISISDPSALASNSDFTALAGRIIAKQSLQVDGVSGASYSSTAMRKAIEAAF
jgi:uncharacterized protein with FMN-binding domain